MLTSLPLARYITNLRENAEEGTKLLFEGGLDRVEDLDKVFMLWSCCRLLVGFVCNDFWASLIAVVLRSPAKSSNSWQ